jgi:hypothetical protein
MSIGRVCYYSGVLIVINILYYFNPELIFIDKSFIFVIKTVNRVKRYF